VYPFGLTTIKGIVEEWNYNSDSKLIDLILSLPIKAGSTTVDPNYWISDVDGLLATDLTAGVSEIDYQVTTDMSKMKMEYPPEDAIVTEVQNEVVDGAETGKKVYDVDVYPYGYENEKKKDISGVQVSYTECRPLDPDGEMAIGDKVKISQHHNKIYLEPLKQISVAWFKIVDVLEDYLSCNMYDQFGELITDVLVNVAKQYMLRRSPFDGTTRNGISYAYTGDESRVATKSGEDPITEYVTSSFQVGDLIVAERFIHGGTFCLEAPDWLMRSDGRAWAESDT
jgi:hypothetical protein